MRAATVPELHYVPDLKCHLSLPAFWVDSSDLRESACLMRAHHLAGGQDGCELAGRAHGSPNDAASLTHDVIVNEGDGRPADFFATQGIAEIMLPFSPAGDVDPFF